MVVGVLHVHRSARADHLADALAEVLSRPLADPMAREVISVPTRGVERWLSQHLGSRLGASDGGTDGICANVDWPFPGGLVAMATEAAWSGRAPGNEGPAGFPWWARPAGGPWAPDAMAFALAELVDQHLDDDWMAPLAAHLKAASPPRPGAGPRRFATARHLADIFDGYAVHRPEMLLAWEAGELGPAPETERAGWREDVTWQSGLWRLLCARLGVASPARRLSVAAERLEAGPDLLQPLPERLSCFGLTRLPASHLMTLKAISAHREVHLFVLHPSAALWDKVALSVSPGAPLPGRALDPTADLASNPLLRSWGRDARELQLVLSSHGINSDSDVQVAEGPQTLLGLLQAAIRADRAPLGPPAPGAPDLRPVLQPGDRSLQVHSCHGRARQVEVAREAVLHLLASDPTLEPRDVIVMCPDIEEVAPLVSSIFGTAAVSGSPELRTRLADRSLRQANPLLGVAARLLDLAGSRVTATQVMDLASCEAVSRRFGLDEAALSRVERWLAGTGVRWGLDTAHRAAWKLEGLPTGTWRAGLDRLLLGVAVDRESLFGGTLPFGDLPMDDIALVGRLAELLDRLQAALGELSGQQTARGWATALAGATASLACPPADEAWQLTQLAQTLDEAAAGAGASGADPLLDVAEMRGLLQDRLKGRPTRANFRTGDLTVCTLVPMRSVPHRVVCIVGLDDGVFPRHTDQDGDNLLLGCPRVGDRDPSSEDRQLLLDALLAAKQHLVLTYQGRDQHLNRPRPPAVPVAELLEVVDRTVRLEDGRLAREAVVFEHPLQPFDPANYRSGAVLPGRPWRFDTLHLAGAEALAGPKVAPPPFLAGRLEPLRAPTVSLGSLVRWAEHPVRAFLQQRIGFYAEEVPEPLSESVPLELGPLERWALGDRILAARLAGGSTREALAVELARGLLPPGAAGEAALDHSCSVVEALLAQLQDLGAAAGPGRPVEVDISLPDGRALVGTVPGAHGNQLVRCTYSKLGAKHRLRAWAHFLALSAAHPELAPSAVTIGQSEGSRPDRPRTCTQILPPLPGSPAEVRATALSALAILVDLWDRGMCEPLPIYCATSAAWAQAVLQPDQGAGPHDKARKRWAPDFDESYGEGAEPEHVAVLGEGVDFERLLQEAPAPDETGPGWATADGSRFSRLALRLWGPLLVHELPLRER
jgi:exodeoxyribonuclease V gamma subunit